MTHDGFDEREIGKNPLIPSEIERKFLISPEAVPTNLDVRRTLNILQAYLTIAEDGSEARVRKTTVPDDSEEPSFELTIKSKGGLVRSEQTAVLTESLFESLMVNHTGIIIQKIRSEIPHGEATIELDMFLGDLDGLVVAEVEFHGTSDEEALESAASFDVPEWFTREVTDNSAYKNQSLALRGLPDESSDSAGSI